MWPQVLFNFTTWSARYPEFAGISAALVQLYFNEAGMYCDNSPSSVIPAGTGGNLVRDTILNMLTAHICALNTPGADGDPNPLVGRVASASQGSVSVSVELEGADASRAWYSQTKYGLAAWQLMAPFKTASYVPACSGVNPFPGMPVTTNWPRPW